MKKRNGIHECYRFGEQWHCLVVLLTFAVCVHSSGARAEPADSFQYRISAGDDKYNDARQVAVAFQLGSHRILSSSHIEIAVGSISTPDEIEAFVSMGPVWRFPMRDKQLFFTFGISPTLLSGSVFSGRDVGGLFHFTSSVAIGAVVGHDRQFVAELRMQHTSNGSLGNTNPGMDMIGIGVTFEFDD